MITPQPDQIIDITHAIGPDMNVWPGDTPLSREVLMSREAGDPVTLSTIRSTVHLGTHADGTNHYARADEGGVGIGLLPLTHFLGPCTVLDVRVPRAQRATPAHVGAALHAPIQPRVLLRTGTFPDFRTWNADFAALSVELVEALASRGVLTIGVDTPSVDLQDSKTLEAHRAIFRARIAILEGLNLAAVAPGDYTLIALPLRLNEFDASPVRAVLLPLG